MKSYENPQKANVNLSLSKLSIRCVHVYFIEWDTNKTEGVGV